MLRLSSGALLPALVCVISGCQAALLGGAGSPAALIRFGNSVRELDATQAEQQSREIAAQNEAAPSDEAAIKLSLLLSRPGASFGDIGEAIRLLDGVAQPGETRAAGTAELARLLRHWLEELDDAAAENAALAEMLAMERDGNRRLDEERAELQAALADERRRRETLQGQLDALKALEEQITTDELEERQQRPR